MKTMKSLKQQMTAAFSLILMVMTIAVCAPDQALANGKGRVGAAANVQPRNNARPRSQPRRITISSEGFEAGVLPASSARRISTKRRCNGGIIVF
jgi:hypothetical protein